MRRQRAAEYNGAVNRCGEESRPKLGTATRQQQTTTKQQEEAAGAAAYAAVYEATLLKLEAEARTAGEQSLGK